MSGDRLIKVTATASEICGRFAIRGEAKSLLENGMGPWEFLETLAANKFYVDAIDFLAYALPSREGVWWGCLCFQHACGDKASTPDRAAIAAVVQWVLQSTDSARVAAKAQAEMAGPASVAGVLAMAVSQTAPPAAPDGGPQAPAALFAFSKSVANAVKLACMKGGRATIIPMQRSYVQLGIGVAAGHFM